MTRELVRATVATVLLAALFHLGGMTARFAVWTALTFVGLYWAVHLIDRERARRDAARRDAEAERLWREAYETTRQDKPLKLVSNDPKETP